MPPYQGGGDMISSVTFEKTEYAELPNKFEAGTPHIAGAVGLAAAIDYVESVGGLSAIAAYEDELLDYARQKLEAAPGVRPIGTAAHKAAVLSFVIETPPIPAHDVGILLDGEGVAVRTGHHCCQPVMDRLGLRATVRASLAMYNTRRGHRRPRRRGEARSRPTRPATCRQKRRRRPASMTSPSPSPSHRSAPTRRRRSWSRRSIFWASGRRATNI